MLPKGPKCVRRFFSAFLYLVHSMERETGIEPATFSLGNRPSTENNEHSVSGHLVLAIEITENLESALAETQMEHKWSTRRWNTGCIPVERTLRREWPDPVLSSLGVRRLSTTARTMSASTAP